MHTLSLFGAYFNFIGLKTRPYIQWPSLRCIPLTCYGSDVRGGGRRVPHPCSGRRSISTILESATKANVGCRTSAALAAASPIPLSAIRRLGWHTAILCVALHFLSLPHAPAYTPPGNCTRSFAIWAFSFPGVEHAAGFGLVAGHLCTPCRMNDVKTTL